MISLKKRSPILNLTFLKLAYGSHQAPYDLQVLLYRGGAAAPRHKVLDQLAQNKFGTLIEARLPLVYKLHEILCTDLEKGLSQVTVTTRIEMLKKFYGWCDENNKNVDFTTVEANFNAWVESLLFRARVVREVKETTVYRVAKGVDYLISHALNIKLGLLRSTRLRVPKEKKRALGTQADKQNLSDTFAFGHFLLDVINSLSTESIKGTLPIEVKLRDGRSFHEWSKLKPAHTILALQDDSDKRKYDRLKALEARRAWEADTSLRTRYPLVNLRIDAELLIFISQTGMNLSQAHKLTRGDFRYQSNGEEVKVFRAYKGRRSGEVEFQIFKEYSNHFKKYLAWIKEFSDTEDVRLFPYSYQGGQIPAAHKAPHFQAIGLRCTRLGITCFKPTALRSTRLNWLLRRSRDPGLTAQMAQHTQETLIRVYERPHHQAAASEISLFHRLNDPSISPPGPGACVGMGDKSRAIKNAPSTSPAPDCISPAGCLFCDFHRDIESEDYIWCIATYRHCKLMELERFTPPRKPSLPHPAVTVIDRITAKLRHFEATNDVHASWVNEASDRIREGRFHPTFDGLIQLMELGA